jgi:hypothetical protein
MFRVYPGGRFSKGITDSPVKKVRLSCEKGEGLQLPTTSPGHILIFAGGTGLFTFSDLIDLLYKEQLMEHRPECKKAVLNLSPLLKDKPFERFTFELFLALSHIDDLHFVTFDQLLFLAERKRIKVTFRLKDKANRSTESENIKFT